MRRFIFGFFLLVALSNPAVAADQPLLFQSPTLSKNEIAFVFAGDLWIVGRNGGRANRLTTGSGIESRPYFSPDGSLIAFTGQYDGNTDVFVVSANGGVPRRLTYHPGDDVTVGWTPDGSKILFRSPRFSYRDSNRLFTVSPNGGFPTELPLPRAEEGSYSSDTQQLAYVPLFQWQPAWKRYRGGQTKLIWIANLKDSSVESLPRENSNDFNPMWIGNSIYFLSDRNGPFTLFRYDIPTKQVTQVLQNDGFDFKAASAGPGGIVYEQFGLLHLYDLSTNTSKEIQVSLEGDFPEVRAHFQKVPAKSLTNAQLSPTGVRAVFEARGEIVTVPSEKGDIRNLTRSTAVMERDPAWSPDGKWIAYFSDESGEYALHIRNQNGLGDVRKINLGTPPSFFYTPRWSPDSKKIAYTDKRLNIWYVDIEKQKLVKVDTDYYESYIRERDPAWAPNSQWIAYAKFLPNHLHAIFIYSLESGKTQQITDGMSDALYPQFDVNGKYLYFAASTNMALSVAWLDLSSLERPVTRSIYVVVLDKNEPSPITPESDEEKAEAKGEKKDKDDKEESKKKTATVRIDFENIGQRIITLPVPARNYMAMAAGKEGNLFLMEGRPVLFSSADTPPTMIAYKFDLKTRKTDKYLEEINSFAVSSNGEKMLYSKAEKWFLTPTEKPPKPEDEKELAVDSLEVYTQPKEEWAQMYHEVWRLFRDYFYDPGYHGLDINAAEKEYSRFLPNLASRVDLNYLMVEMLGEFTAGHIFVEGGDTPEVKKVQVGLLGAEYGIENGKYRFTRIFNGENWNPELRAPLTQPGVNVSVGEYLITVNGQKVDATKEVFSYFEGTAGKSTTIEVSKDPDGKNAREVIVVPVDSETNLRYLAWIEGNRRKVDELSGGRIAYVHLPDTFSGGFSNFNRYYFAQVGKEGAVIDERYNHGGALADYVIDLLHRPMMSLMMTREGAEMASPFSAIYGPKAMIINEMSGSGGDAMPWYFRKAKIGPLVGKKTWGGLIGIYDYPALMDGGVITAPRIAIYGLSGEWEVENVGISPDIEVEFDPKLVMQGHDPQLEKAVEVVMDMLQKNPLPKYKRPAYPNYHQKVGKEK
jgi:tricorn protease